MRAFFSSRSETIPTDVSHAIAYMDAQAIAALDEARRIMAETEPMGTDYYAGRTTFHSAVYFNARTLTHGTMLSEAQSALADALTAFVEAC